MGASPKNQAEIALFAGNELASSRHQEACRRHQETIKSRDKVPISNNSQFALMPVASIVKTGQVLDDRFLLTEEIGRGGMSVVYKAKDLHNQDELVAVKVPHSRFASCVGSWSMFQQEEAIGRRLNHPYVLRFLPLAENKRRAYMVTEYVPGQTLAERLNEQRPLPESEALSIASRICEALTYIHEQGYVHYDLKPANIMLSPNGTIRLIDFGLSHAAVAGRFSFSGRPPELGTADYVAPEQIRRKKGRKSADVYGVGAMLYGNVNGPTTISRR